VTLENAINKAKLWKEQDGCFHKGPGSGRDVASEFYALKVLKFP
jgi:hypothetical protein